MLKYFYYYSFKYYANAQFMKISQTIDGLYIDQLILYAINVFNWAWHSNNNINATLKVG
jgi:hypothetical protein